MSLRLMRWVDHWVGLPICFLLGLIAKAKRKFWPKRREVTGKRPIAVFKFFGFGSIVEATPLFRAIRKRYPGCQLAFVTFAENVKLLRLLEVADELRVIRTHNPFLFVFDVLKQCWWMRRSRVEAVIDLEFFSKFSTLLGALSGARIRVGFHLNDFWRYSLVTHPIYFNYFRHIADVYEQAGQQLDVTIGDAPLERIVVSDASLAAARAFLEVHGWRAPAPLLGVNVNAGELSYERRWPLERFATVVDTLLARHEDLYVVLTGSPSEQAYIGSLVETLSRALRHRLVVAAGHWSLEEFVGSLSLFDGFLTGDSGPLHLAAAQGVPIVSIWGPSRPEFYAPRVEANRVIYVDYPCSPCVCMFTTFEGMWCNHAAWCMQAISPHEVLEQVEAMLAESRRRGAERT